MPDLGKIHPTFVLKDQRLADFKALLPEGVADGQIDWTGLRQALGEALEDDTQEPFGLSWPGKREAKKMAFTPPKGTLKPQVGRGVNEETTCNLIIEGDNLEVLKLLQKSYFRRVKMIYIDPPYNTGNDFVYSDNFTDTIDDYLRKTGALDADGKPLSTNPKTSGRFHSNWLSMMYPRLVLAKTLLRDDGVIFVSIDDNEVHHLRQIMDEVFGEENFVAQIVWQRSKKGDSKLVATIHEYILCFVRNKKGVVELGKWRNPKDGADSVLSQYEILNSQYSQDHEAIHAAMVDWYKTLPREDVRKKHKHYCWSDDRGLYFAADFSGPDDGRKNRPRHDILHPVTGLPCKKPATGWRWDKKKTDWALVETPPRIHFGPDETTIPNRKSYLKEVAEEPFSSVFYRDGRSATLEVAELVGEGLFSFPKNTEVLTSLFQLVTKKGDLILDFFAGSGTTAQAVLELNQQDGGHRQFILVQIPEKTGRQDYPTIADITKERVRRVIAKMTTPVEEVAEAAPGYLNKSDAAPDRGFRVLALDKSNLKAWDLGQSQTLEGLEKQLQIFADSPLVDGWKPENLLVEVMLWEGFAPISTVTRKKAGTDTFFCVSDPHMAYRLWCCFDTTHDFTLADIKALGAAPDDLFVFLDSSLPNALKSRLVDLVKLKVV